MHDSREFHGQDPPAPLLRLLAVLAALRVVFFAAGSPQLVSDTKFYFPWAVLAVDGGRTPYRDFAVEYPPGSWAVIVWPRLLGPEQGELARLLPEMQQSGLSASSAAKFQRAYAHYRRVFRWQMFAVDLAALALMAWLLARHVEKAPLALAVYGAGSLTLVPILYDRLDPVLWLLMLSGGFLWLEAWQDRRRSTAWLVAAAFCWGLGVAYKLIPLVSAPALALALWRRNASWGQRLLPLGAGTLGAAGPFALASLTAGKHVLDFLRYHGQRGTQYESLWGSVQMALGQLGLLPAKTAEVAKAVDVQSPLAPALVWASYALTLVSVGWVCLQLGRCPREKLPRLGLAAAGLCLLWATTWGKVLSPQYMIWAGPLAVLTVALGVPGTRQMAGHAWVFAVWLLTAAIYPWGYLYWGLESPRLVGLVLLRNGLLLGLCGWLSKHFGHACRRG